MAAVIPFPYITGRSLYGVFRDAAGLVWDGSAFVTPSAASWATYAVAATEATATGLYAVAIPALAAGRYHATIYLRSGGSPAVGDAWVGSEEFSWSGTAIPTDVVLTPGTISAATSGSSFASATTSLDATTAAYAGMQIQFTSGVNAGQRRTIATSTRSGSTTTFATAVAFAEAPGVGDSFLIG